MPHDSLAVVHLLGTLGLKEKDMGSLPALVDGVAQTVRKERLSEFLAPYNKDKDLPAIAEAWNRATGGAEDSPFIVGSMRLHYMPRPRALQLFGLGAMLTLQKRLAERNPRMRYWLESYRDDPIGRRLHDAIKLSIGGDAPEAPLGRMFGNSFARVLCRSLKFCLYLHAVYVYLKDAEGAAATEGLASLLPRAVPLGYGSFDGKSPPGPVFMVNAHEDDAADFGS